MMRGKLFWLALLGGIAWLLYRALRQSQQLVPVQYTPPPPSPSTTAPAAPVPEPVLAVPVPPVPPAPPVEREPVVAEVPPAAEADLVVEAYCVRCKERRVMVNPEETITTNGRHAMRGSCPLCGAKLFRFVAG